MKKARITYLFNMLQLVMLLAGVAFSGRVAANNAAVEVAEICDSCSLTVSDNNDLAFLNNAALNVQVEELPINVEVEQEEATKSYPALSVKTNLLYDLFYTPQTGFQPMPNVEVEYYFRNGHMSVLAELESPWWSNEGKQEYFQMQNVQLEPRYYFKGDHRFNGHFIGVYGNANLFDFALKGKNGSGVQGEGFGAGLSYGYVLPLGGKDSRWKMEFNVKVGFYETHYDPYDYDVNSSGEKKFYYRYYGDTDNFVKRNWRYRWVGPTGVGVTLSYDLFKRHKK